MSSGGGTKNWHLQPQRLIWCGDIHLWYTRDFIVQCVAEFVLAVVSWVTATTDTAVEHYSTSGNNVRCSYRF